MNSNDHPFNFDVNFSFGTESVFTDVKTDLSPNGPAPDGFFLLLDETPMLLLNGQDFALL